jgi:hypothetical protein
MKTGPKLPNWIVVASLVAVCLVVGVVSWIKIYPNDPAMDGHGHKIFTPDEIARFRAEAARQPPLPRR